MEAETAGDATSGFDARAAGFDRRSAPDAAAARRIAATVLAAGAGGEAAGGALLDLGAGTGAVGAPLAEGCVAAGRRYLALDLSLPMLTRFRVRLGDTEAGGAVLLRADAGRRWPLADGSVGTLFAARVAHLLDAAALAAEVRRVVAVGGRVLLATVRHDPASPRSALRRRLHELLAEAGWKARDARRSHDGLAGRLAAATGGTVTPPRIVAEWAHAEAPATTLAAWRRPGHLAGRKVPEPLRTRLIDELERWAADRYAAADAQSSQERYEITEIRIGSGR